MGIKVRTEISSITIRNEGYTPLLSFIDSDIDFHEIKEKGNIVFNGRKIIINNNGSSTILKISLRIGDHIYGLGEKPGRMERNRSIHSLYNTSDRNYNRNMKNIYSSFPSFIVVSTELMAVIINCGAEIFFDFGVSDYNNIIIKIPVQEFEVFISKAISFNNVMEWHSKITGKPFKLPNWALGHQVSRWSYYPQDVVEEIRDRYLEEFPLSAVYLDIDYMDNYKVFTWDSKKFPDPEKLVKDSLEKGVRIIPVIDPGIKIDQDSEIFRKFLGQYIEDDNHCIFTGYVWPGLCSFPDFINEQTRKIWGESIKKFAGIGIEGIWLDMNEPSIKVTEGFDVENGIIDRNTVHKLNNGQRVRHGEIHNFYSYFQAVATYDSLKEMVKEPFILTRSGYTGIQKYCAMWTGDNEASYDDLLLQMVMVMSLGISGMPYVGCDLGGFQGHSDYELLTKYYYMALFFPVYRNHKIREGDDQELFNIPDSHKMKIKQTIEIRMKFMEYLISVVDESSSTGHPVIRPLFYHYYKDKETLSIGDQYMVGSELIYAPQVFKDRTSRTIYIPEGKWIDYNTGNQIKSKSWVESSYQFPIYLSPALYTKVKDK